MKILKDSKEIYPIVNKNYLVVTSPNVNKPRFQYVADLNIIDTPSCSFLTSSSIGQLRFQPNTDGVGIVEVNNVYRDYINFDLDFDMTFKWICQDPKNWTIYNIDFGESYTTEWIADDFIFLTSSNPALSQLCLTTDTVFGGGFSNITHDYIVGDQINITSTDETKVKSGIWRITEIVSNKTVRLNQFWQSSGTAFQIPTEFADGRRTDFLGLSQSTGAFLFNGSLNDDQWFYYNEFDWIMGSNNTNGRLITGIPDWKCENCGSGYQNFTNDFDRIYWWNDPNDFFGAQWSSLGTNVVMNIETATDSYTFNMVDFPTLGSVGFGTGNLSKWGLTIDEDYLFYLSEWNCCDGDICVTTDKILMKKKEVDCSDSLVKIVFYDDLGGWSTINFNKNFKKTTNVDRKKFDGFNYKKFVYDPDSDTGDWCGDRRLSDESITSNKSEEIFRVSTEFLYDEEIRYIEQLLRSRKVFWMKKGELDRWYPYPINLMNNSWEMNSTLIHRYKTFTIEFVMANKNDFI
jgi:hypothetical protein